MLRHSPSRFLRLFAVDARSGDSLARLATIAANFFQNDVNVLNYHGSQRSVCGPAPGGVIDPDARGVGTSTRSPAVAHRWFSTDKHFPKDGEPFVGASEGSDEQLAPGGEGKVQVEGIGESKDPMDGDPANPVAGSPPPKNTFDSVNDALEAWEAAMDNGDWDSAWQIFDQEFPIDSAEFPTIEQMLAWNPEEEERAQRRHREEALQEQAAMLRTRKVDGSGRSHAVGKRKTSVARVWLREGPGHVMVNRRPYDAYFPVIERRNDIIAPFLVTETLGKFDVMAAVHGGGQTGQAQALRHGIARALQAWDPDYRPELKAAGLLTRDARIVERKKPGLKKARKAFQWVKR